MTRSFCLLLSAFCLLPSARAATDDLAVRQQAAVRAAVDRIAPSVVRIETLGGLEAVDDVLFGSGASTGLVVSSEGHIISSAFNFVQKPAQTLVYLADGTRLPAEIVARDDSRMLVLLKVPTDGLDVARQLPVPVAVPAGEMQVGAWAIAVGRVFELGKPNLSVGIVSALGRIWGKAIQTDAKISPANYGGPLVDLHGRVFGVLVPMSPQESGEVAGADLYDSGIGFAVPLEHVFRVLDRMKSGQDLHPGLAGVSMRSADMYADDPIIAACHPRSPADEAGFKAGDKVIEIDGVPVATHAQMRRQLGPRYAGEQVTIVAMRGNERIEQRVELVEKLLPYVNPFLGILPMRDDAGPGVVVRYVYPDSPATKAGVEVGDRILQLDGQKVTDRFNLQELIGALEPLKQTKITIERGGKPRTLEATLATLPEAAPDELPPARGDASEAPAEAEKADALGKVEIKIPELPNDCVAYVPDSYRKDRSHGIVVWLHPTGSFKDDDVIAQWKEVCAARDLILLLPHAADAQRWQRTDLEFLRKAMDDIAQKYNVDRTRVVVVGEDTGGALGYVLTADNRDLVRGVAALNSAFPAMAKIPVNEPAHRLAIFATMSDKSPPALAAGIKRLRDAKHPVTEKHVGADSRPLTADELQHLARWIDTLDRS